MLQFVVFWRYRYKNTTIMHKIKWQDDWQKSRCTLLSPYPYIIFNKIHEYQSTSIWLLNIMTNRHEYDIFLKNKFYFLTKKFIHFLIWWWQLATQWLDEKHWRFYMLCYAIVAIVMCALYSLSKTKKIFSLLKGVFFIQFILRELIKLFSIKKISFIRNNFQCWCKNVFAMIHFKAIYLKEFIIFYIAEMCQSNRNLRSF